MATTITANGINFPDGSASAPSIGGTDTNTGLFTGSDIVGFATGGLERIRIDASGRVIIGDDHTNNAFAGGDSLIIGNEDNGTRSGITLVSASNTDGGLYFSHGSSNTTQGQVVYNHANNYMAFYVNGSNRALNILGGSNGYITMGRNDALASARLSLQCSAGDPGISIQTNTSGGTVDLIKAYNSAGPNVASICVNPDSTPDLLFKLHDGSNTVERVRITSAGRLGVGTTSPDHIFEVESNNSSIAVSRSGANAQLLFKSNSVGQVGQIQVSESTGGGVMIFSTKTTGGSVSERLRITSAGNVGIGTTSPGRALHVTVADAPSAKFGGGTHFIELGQLASGSSAGLNIVGGSNMLFRMGGTEAMRIDPSGRVLIGLNANHANASIDDLQVGNPNSATQRGITIGSGDECAIAFSDAGDARAGSITYNHGSNIMIFKTEGQNERLSITSEKLSVGGKTSYAAFRTHSSRGLEWNLNAINSPQNHSSGISGWVFLGHDYGANPYPVRTFKIATPEGGSNVIGTRVYQVWHDGDSNYDYGGLWEIRINQWNNSSRFESVSIRCVNGKRDDMAVYAYDDTNGIMIRPSTIWGTVYLRLAGYDNSQGYRSSSHCAVANNGALAIYNAQGTDNGTVPTSGNPVDVYPFDGHGGSHSGGRDIENSNWFNG